jgi:perosamine synthetase
MLPVAVPVLKGREGAYLKECLDTNWISSGGPFVERFEREVAARTGAAYAVATASGTAALHTALMACGVQAEDEVLVSAFTFVAPANAIRHAGAWPVFVDAEPNTWQMDPQLVARFLAHDCTVRAGRLTNRRTGRQVRALLPVHVLGHPCDMDPLVSLANQYGLILIEDAAESLGAAYRGLPLGGFGRSGCYSFNGNKLVTSGGGGMLVTNDAALASAARHLTTQAKLPTADFDHDRVGYNYRLTNLQAALGVAQMEQLDAFVTAKRTIAATYDLALAEVAGITPMPEAPWARSTFWLYTVLVDPERYGRDNRALSASLLAEGIASQPRWRPLYQTGAHRGSQALVSGVAENLHQRALSLPCSVDLTADQIRTVAACIRANAL